MTEKKQDAEAQEYRVQKLLLRFHNKETERIYRATILDTTLTFLRVSWGAVILLGSLFYLLDHSFFGDTAPTIITARVTLLCIAGTMLGLTWWRSFRPVLVLCPAIFVLFTASFCVLQTALSPPGGYSPYIMGVFLAYCGVFCTLGMGFTFSVFALLFTMLLFEFLVGVLYPVEPGVFLLYNFFFASFVLVFVFLGYYIEYMSRKRFVVSAQLQDSMDKVNTLRGLLPICASCKQIRDDKGYWNQIDSYLSTHSEMEFSHSICPQCANEMYPELRLSSQFPDQ